MKIGVLSCIYGRPKVTEVFCKGLVRLKENFGVFPLIVGSEGEASLRFAREYGLLYLRFNNRPLGAKFNAGMRAIMSYNLDYVMVLGSDDLISDDYMECFVKIMKTQKPDLIGTTDCYFYSPTHKKLGYWDGYRNARKGETIGMGRTLSKKLIYKLKLTPWFHGINKGLDGSMMSQVLRHRPKIISLSQKKENIFAVDIKSKGNITSFGAYKHLQKEPIELINTHLPWETKQIMAL